MVIIERTPEAKAKSPILYKPSFEAIEVVIFIANFDPEKTIFFDDSARNIASGKVAGRHTVIVRALQLKKNN
ncbi:hypothetical protein L3X38_015421 [Prunus dulcis]|uniref:Haloacid dehalogenase-like hydrolase superfamily protein n=1 Tax=Prunus dulcis TaxID=3755 RepID=A0AAD4W3E0_PRUDU|nr:hypothetical protein L3X38_015421 [Prunus dulcis]